MKMDCNDRSDEDKCTQIKIDRNNYIKEYIPGDPNGKAQLNVRVTFDIKEIVEINEPHVS